MVTIEQCDNAETWARQQLETAPKGSPLEVALYHVIAANKDCRELLHKIEHLEDMAERNLDKPM